MSGTTPSASLIYVIETLHRATAVREIYRRHSACAEELQVFQSIIRHFLVLLLCDPGLSPDHHILNLGVISAVKDD